MNFLYDSTNLVVLLAKRASFCYRLELRISIPLSTSSKEQENLTGLLSSTVCDWGVSTNRGPVGSSSGTENTQKIDHAQFRPNLGLKQDKIK